MNLKTALARWLCKDLYLDLTNEKELNMFLRKHNQFLENCLNSSNKRELDLARQLKHTPKPVAMKSTVHHDLAAYLTSRIGELEAENLILQTQRNCYNQPPTPGKPMKITEKLHNLVINIGYGIQNDDVSVPQQIADLKAELTALEQKVADGTAKDATTTTPVQPVIPNPVSPTTSTINSNGGTAPQTDTSGTATTKDATESP